MVQGSRQRPSEYLLRLRPQRHPLPVHPQEVKQIAFEGIALPGLRPNQDRSLIQVETDANLPPLFDHGIDAGLSEKSFLTLTGTKGSPHPALCHSGGQGRESPEPKRPAFPLQAHLRTDMKRTCKHRRKQPPRRRKINLAKLLRGNLVPQRSRGNLINFILFFLRRSPPPASREPPGE
jgi:hypothetical protein